MKIVFIKNFDDIKVGDLVFTSRNDRVAYRVIKKYRVTLEVCVKAAYTLKHSYRGETNLSNLIDETLKGVEYEQDVDYMLFDCKMSKGVTLQ